MFVILREGGSKPQRIQSFCFSWYDAGHSFSTTASVASGISSRISHKHNCFCAKRKRKLVDIFIEKNNGDLAFCVCACFFVLILYTNPRPRPKIPVPVWYLMTKCNVTMFSRHISRRVLVHWSRGKCSTARNALFGRLFSVGTIDVVWYTGIKARSMCIIFCKTPFWTKRWFCH